MSMSMNMSMRIGAASQESKWDAAERMVLANVEIFNLYQ